MGVTFDDAFLTLDLPPEARKGDAAFDRFGILSYNRGGHFVEVYLDDLSYTISGDPWVEKARQFVKEDPRYLEAIRDLPEFVRDLPWDRQRSTVTIKKNYSTVVNKKRFN